MVAANIAVLAGFRVGFIATFIDGIVWGSFTLISIVLITTKISSIAGWSGTDLVLLAGMYNIVIGAFYIFCAPNFHDIPNIMRYGKLDLYLIRPLDAQFLLNWRAINLGGFGRFIFGIIAVVIIANQRGIHPSFLTIAQMTGTTVLACLFLYGVWASISCIFFWQSRLSNLIELLYTTTGFGRYPRETLATLPIFFTIVTTPFFLTVSTPTKLLRGTFQPIDLIILMIAALISITLSRVLWKLGLRSYVGASG